MDSFNYMNDRQRALFEAKRSEYAQIRTLTPSDIVHLHVLACVLEQIEVLQHTINSEGSTYASVNRDGQTLIKEHPAQRHLAQCRATANITAGKLSRGTGEAPADELSEFLKDSGVTTT